MGLTINRRQRKGPKMATRPYEVEYDDGRVRIKMLSTDGAGRVAKQGDVADVRLPADAPAGEPKDAEDVQEDDSEPESKQASPRRNKGRRPAGNK